MRDDASGYLVLMAIYSVTADGETTGITVDTAGVESATFEVSLANYTDGDHVVSIQESDNEVDWAECSNDCIANAYQGKPLQSVIAVCCSVFSTKRYVRCNIVSTNVTTGSDVVAANRMFTVIEF